MCCDTKPVCTQLLMSLFCWSLSRHNFPCYNKQLFFSLAALSQQDFFKSLAIFYRDKKFLRHDRFFFSGSYCLLSCLSRHRIICCDTISLSILKSSSIPTFLCHDKILSFLSFYCRDRKLLYCDKSFAFNSWLCRNKNFFVSILLVLLFSILLRQGIHLLLVLSVAIEIIFVATEIVLPLVVNCDCYVATAVLP